MPTPPPPGRTPEQLPTSDPATPRTSSKSIRSVSAWEKALARLLAAAHLTAVATEPFRGRLRSRDLDVLCLLHLEVEPHALRSQPADAIPSYQILLPLKGSFLAAQQGRRATVGPGQFVLLEATTTYEVVFEEAATVVGIRVPHRVVSISPVMVRQITATGIGVDGDVVSSIMMLLARLADDLIGSSPHHAARLAYNLIDLLTTVLLEQLSIVVPGGPAQQLMLKITAYVDAHLGENDLSAETVAAAHYISPRYLRKLYEAQNMKVSEWIRNRRLEAVRRQLVDPVLADEPISAVAARWGFPDPAHFSRLFKATYGRSPRQFRREGLHGTPCGHSDG